MANARGKEIDNTHLSADTTEERLVLHRDLISHAFRWSHVARALGGSQRYKTARVLDVGCGVDIPLARLLYSNRFLVEDYAGVDYNKSSKFKKDMFEKGRFPLSVYGHVDFASKQVRVRKPEFLTDLDEEVLYINGDTEEGEHRLPNVIVCYEAVEHVEPSHARAILRKIHFLLSITRGVAYISTPCYNYTDLADNHVSEITRDALGALLEDLNFEIFENYGTFASQRDYKNAMLKERPELDKLWSELHSYYDSNVLSTIFAPIFPQYSRNNIWGLRVADTKYVRKFPPLSVVKGPWTSSARWAELASDEAYKMEI